MRTNKVMTMLAGVIAASFILTGCITRSSSDGAQRAVIETNSVSYDPITTVGNEVVKGEANYYQLFFIFSWGDENIAEFAFSHGKRERAMEFQNIESAFATILAPFIYGMFGYDIHDALLMASTYDACKKSDSYALAAARYDFCSRNFLIFKKITCKTAGYPVKITGVKLRPIEHAKAFDIKLSK